MAKDVLKVLRTQNSASFPPRLTPDYRLAEPWMLGGEKEKGLACEGEEFALQNAGAAAKAVVGIVWTCQTRLGNQLMFNGAPFRAQCLTYLVDNISWQPGSGWPVYNSYCPQPDYLGSMRFRDAKRHQIVPVYGNYYWVGCNNPGTGCGQTATDVYVWVNDDAYDDNNGTFRFIVTAWH